MTDRAWDYIEYALYLGVTLAFTQTDQQPKFSARVISEQEVMVTFGAEPTAFRYGNHSHGTTELCLSNTQNPLCFRSPDLRTDSREKQKITLTPQWPR